MTFEHIKDYLWSQILPGIDNKELLGDCLEIEKYLKKTLKDTDRWMHNTTYDTFTGKKFEEYNKIGRAHV